MRIGLNIAIRVPGEEPREFELSFDKPVITIGRDRDNDIQIPLSTVSRRHARIYEENSEWFIEDLRSTHGTKVNGQILGSGGKKLLREGDQIQIVHAFIDYRQVDERHLEEAPVNEEQTSVVARKMVQDVLNHLDENHDIPHLIIMNGPQEGKKIDLGPNVNEVVLGRGENSDFRVDDVNISRRHAVIRRDWNEILIEDLSSKNGVMVNGQKISAPTRLTDADEIYLGAVHLTFVDPTAGILGRLGEVPAFAQEVAKEKGEANSEKPKETATTPETLPPEENPSANESVSTTDEAAPVAFAEPPPTATSTAGTNAIDVRAFGFAEYVLIGLAVLVAVGLVIGVVIALI